MSSNQIVLQLAKFNDNSSINTASWSNHINEPLTLNEGDEIIVTKAFLDTRNLSSSNIFIAEDIDLELEIYFYWINDSNPGSNPDGFGTSQPFTKFGGSTGFTNVWSSQGLFENQVPAASPPIPALPLPSSPNENIEYAPVQYTVITTLQNEPNILMNTGTNQLFGVAGERNCVSGRQNVLFADGRPYVMCYTDNSAFTKTWKYTLKAGNYDPGALSTILTENMSIMKKETEESLQNSEASNWLSNGLSFVVDTNSYPPLWSNISYVFGDHSVEPSANLYSTINMQPNIQIDETRGAPIASDYLSGSTGSDFLYNPSPNVPGRPSAGPAIQPAGTPPKRSLCFKNFISDAPTPDATQNLPVFDSNITLYASKMIVNEYYTIFRIGQTDWHAAGYLLPNVANGVGFLCIKTPPPLDQSIDGIAVQVLNPDFPNFFMYPLILKSSESWLSWADGWPDQGSYNYSINMFWGGSVLSYGFPLVGSTQVELAFNSDVNRMQWNYTHSPIQQGAAPVPNSGINQTAYQNVVGVVNSFQPTNDPTTSYPYNSSTCKLTQQSGFMFKRMSPPSFWHNILGFSTDILVTDEQLGLTTDGTTKPLSKNTKDRFTYQRFNEITTRDLLSGAMNFTDNSNFPNSQPSYVVGLRANTPVSGQITGPVQLNYLPESDQWAANEINYSFFNVFTDQFLLKHTPTSLPLVGTINSSYYQCLDITNAIIAENPPLLVSDTTGHYLISIDGYGNDKNGLLNENSKVNSKAIVSGYYVNAGSFTSLTIQDAQIYQHVGASIILSDFNINILDPITLKPIVGLGNNTSVYVQVNKTYSPLELTQTLV